MTQTRTKTYSEVVAGLVVWHKRDGRCVYSRAGKRALAQPSLKRGASVAPIAQQHGVNANLLRKWIDAFRGRDVNYHAVSPRVPKLLPIIEIVASPAVRRSVSSGSRFHRAYR